MASPAQESRDSQAERIPRVLASTTSHKREPLLAVLEVFSRLGLCDLDLNLHPLLEGRVPVEAIAECASVRRFRVWIVSGGWCDFFQTVPDIDATNESVDRQVEIARRLGVSRLRLFFGRLRYEDYSQARRQIICDNLTRLSDRHPDISFAFENHDGASLHPEVCAEVLASVQRPNIRMNFDPINFERHGMSSLRALHMVRPFVGHVHLKGLAAGEFCEFGEGDVDLMPVLGSLVEQGYRGDFTVEYEGPHDKTLRLYRSVQRARGTLQTLETRRACEP